MPLARQKSHIRVLSLLGSERFVIRAPSCGVLPNEFELAWLLWDTQATPLSDETIEQWGDGANTGYRLEFLTTRRFRFTTYGFGGGVVTSSNILAVVGERRFCLVRAQFGSYGSRIILNETATLEPATGMLAPLVGEDRFLCAQNLVGNNRLESLQPAACAVGFNNSLADETGIYEAVRRAQRLLEPAAALSYVDFSRYRPLRTAVPQGHFGDDVTGARVESLVTSTEHRPFWRRADRTTDWSTS